MLIQIVIFVIGLVILAKFSDLLIDAAVSLGKHLNLSNIFIGLTIIAFGTSLPEFLVSFVALTKGSGGISIGNIIGSNIANVALIIGVVGLLFPLRFKHKSEAKGLRKKEILMSIFYMLLILITLDGNLSRIDGLILVGLFFFFLYYSYKQGVSDRSDDLEKKYGLPMSVGLTILSLAGLIVGANMMTTAAVNLATILGVNDYIIGATIVALGTSLPELAASYAAVKRGELGMSLANIVGSNIFNILMVLGFISVFFTIPVDINIVLVDYGVMMFTALILAVCVFRKNKTIPRWVVYLSLIVYIGYVGRLLALAFV